MADRIRKINSSARDIHVLTFGDFVSLSGTRIRSIEASLDGTIYAADFDEDVIYKVFEDGRILGVMAGSIANSGVVHSTGIGASTGLTAEFLEPVGLTVDSSNNIYVGCATGTLIRRLSPSGRVRPFAGNDSVTGDAVGPDGGDLRVNPATEGMGLCVDKTGIVYVADTGNHKIKKIFTNGGSTTLAGATGGGFLNATGTDAKFNTPRDIAVDRHGNVYVADTVNNRIRKITESGVVTTLAGATASGYVDGNGLDARFVSPQRIAIDPSDQFLYVLEAPATGRVRRVDMHGNVTTFAHYNTPTGITNGDITVDSAGNVYILENHVG
jgi:sugar lactone lactonase YvrE